jgi:uncharacterized RDD family membrane protein YckC
MNYSAEQTASTTTRIVVGFLNSLTTILLLVIPFVKNGMQTPFVIVWYIVIGWAIYFIVNFILLVKLYGGTLFHILLNLRIIQVDGKHGLTWLQTLKRFFAGNFLGMFAGLLPYSAAFLNVERRHVGDLWAKTRVISIKSEREDTPKAPRPVLFSIVLVLGILNVFTQTKAYTLIEVTPVGLAFYAPGTTDVAMEEPGIWPVDFKKQFIEHCSSISSEYLQIAFQGQGVDQEMMSKFADSIQALCGCVATEVEKSTYAPELMKRSLATRNEFEALFEEEAFTTVYVQASSTCERLLK